MRNAQSSLGVAAGGVLVAVAAAPFLGGAGAATAVLWLAGGCCTAVAGAVGAAAHRLRRTTGTREDVKRGVLSGVFIGVTLGALAVATVKGADTTRKRDHSAPVRQVNEGCPYPLGVRQRAEYRRGTR
jgi:hypothetical protein